MQGFRDDIEALRQNGITRVAFSRLDDPAVIPLWFGEGDLPTPQFIRQAAVDALQNEDTFYTNTRGKRTLRNAVRDYLQHLYDLDVDIERITIPGSAMLGIQIASHMALGSGRHGIVVSPHWPNIEAAYQVTGADITVVRQRETADGWQLQVDEIIAAMRPQTRAVFVNTPCNPTGWIMPAEDMQALLEVCRERGIVIIADEVYHRTVYEGRVAPSFLAVAGADDPVVVVNSFSKAWAMTGWRIGWVVAPARHAEVWASLSECFNTGATVFAQEGAIAALQQGESLISELQQQYRVGRDLTVEILGSSPHLQLSRPQGAFYGFVRAHGLASSLRFCEQLLAEEDVGCAPGFAFGPDNESYIRICFAMSHPRLQEGLERIVRFVGRHAGDWDRW